MTVRLDVDPTPATVSAAIDFASRHFAVVIAAYFALQAAIRIAVSPELGMDDAELVLLTRSWDWGYGSQPPLYTWLQATVFAIAGESLASVILLKNALLATTCVFVHRTALRVLGDPLAALAAAMSLFLLPQVAWESQRALSHTVLAVAVSSILLLVTVRLVEERRTTDYLLAGALIAAGLLSKLNVVYFVAALAAAAVTTPAGRAALFDRRSLATAAVAAVLLAPTTIWMFGHRDAVTHRVEKFGLGEGDGVVGSLVLGIGDFVVAAAAFLALLVAVAGLLTVRAGRGAAASPSPSLVFLARALAIGLLIVLATVVASGATNVKDRWLQPILFYAPIVVVGLLSRRLPPARLRALALVSALAAMAVMVALPSRIALADREKVPVENKPYGAFAEEIRASTGFESGTILAGDYATGGNLAIRFPDASALIPEYGDLDVPTPWPVLVAWTGDGDAPPAALADAFARRFGHTLPAGEATVIRAPVHYGDGAQDMLRVRRIDQPG
jgi:4-amino-4-deoxy-L-arabinose transferase-like glycosyltransferase